MTNSTKRATASSCDDRKLRGIELKLKKKDGTLIWCRESCHAVYDEQSQVVCFHGMIEDITALKRREDQLRAVNRLTDIGTPLIIF